MERLVCSTMEDSTFYIHAKHIRADTDIQQEAALSHAISEYQKGSPIDRCAMNFSRRLDTDS